MAKRLGFRPVRFANLWTSHVRSFVSCMDGKEIEGEERKGREANQEQGKEGNGFLRRNGRRGGKGAKEGIEGKEGNEGKDFN